MLRRPTIFYSYFELYNRAGKNSRIISNKKEQTVYWYTQQPGWISRTLPLVKSMNLQRLGTIWYPLYNTSKSRDDELSRCCLGTRMQEHGGRGGGVGRCGRGWLGGQQEEVSLWSLNSSVSWLCWWFCESTHGSNSTEAHPRTRTLHAHRNLWKLSKASSPVHWSSLQYGITVACLIWKLYCS